MDGALTIAAFAAGAAGNSFKAVPQFVRTALRGRVAGLSATAVWLSCTAQILWLSFGAAIGDERFVALAAVQTALTAGTLFRFVRETGWDGNKSRAAVAVPAWALLVVIAATGAGVVLESLGAALGVVVGAPQLLYLWRRRHEPTDVSEVSQAEYVVVIAAQVAWTTYWLVQGHPIAAAGAAWGGTARATTLTLLRAQARRVSGVH